MSQVFAAKYAIPHMLEQGSGYLLNVASAAGLLVIFDTVSYTVTKHAAIGFSRVARRHVRRPRHRRQRALPGGREDTDPGGQIRHPGGPGAITTDELADIVIEGLAQERFMINTHPWVLEKFAVKARDYDEYIAMMRAGRAAELAKSAG